MPTVKLWAQIGDQFTYRGVHPPQKANQIVEQILNEPNTPIIAVYEMYEDGLGNSAWIRNFFVGSLVANGVSFVRVDEDELPHQLRLSVLLGAE